MYLYPYMLMLMLTYTTGCKHPSVSHARHAPGGITAGGGTGGGGGANGGTAGGTAVGPIGGGRPSGGAAEGLQGRVAAAPQGVEEVGPPDHRESHTGTPDRMKASTIPDRNQSLNMSPSGQAPPTPQPPE